MRTTQRTSRRNPSNASLEEDVTPTWLQVSNQIEPVLAQKTDVLNKFSLLERSFGCEALNLLTEHYRTAKSELQGEKAKTEQLIANKIEAEQNATAKSRQTCLVRIHAADLDCGCVFDFGIAMVSCCMCV